MWIKHWKKIYQVDNNAYAFMFDEYVYRHFTDYVFNQPKDRLKWGYGRLLGHEDLYHVVKCLLKKEKRSRHRLPGRTALLKGML